ncbi:MAG: RagB/SusD family nutrient uptake outer membrane protein [Bacteroidetes bacterium]|nr:RagB/SusD family nutrient uptake outer membrane protein [Bacteroidota bacterium]
MKKYILFFCVLNLLTLGSCKKFLTEEAEDQFTAATLFETPEGLEKMAIALYPYERGLVTKGTANGILSAYTWNERTTDLCNFTTGDDANLSRYTSPGPSSNIMGLVYSPYWSHRYYIIGRTNEIIHYGAKFGDESKQTVAEASFWRAYCYYGLWSRFSRLFLSTEPVTKENMGSLKYTPADSASIFKLMYDDAKRAVDGLPLTRTADDQGRITRAGARHLLALIAAWAKDWGTVTDQVAAIDAENTVRLEATPDKVFNRSDLYATSETLFALRFSKERGGGTGHRIGSQYINIIAELDYMTQIVNGVQVKYNSENLGREWGLVFPNSYLMSRYKAGDKRLTAYYKIDYAYQNPNKLITIPVAQLKTDASTGKTYYTTSNRTAAPVQTKVGDILHGRDVAAATGTKIDRRNLVPSSIKMYDAWSKPLDADASNSSFKDVMIYRLAESYLLAAEAWFRLGDQVKALVYYNKTWTRAGNAPETGPLTFQMIMDEQARELAFEGRRWDFLKRNGIWYDQVRKYAGDFTKFPGTTVAYSAATYGISDGRDAAFGPNPDFYADFNGADNDILVRFNVKPIHVNWPIPQDQIDAMGVQNFPQTTGY